MKFIKITVVLILFLFALSMPAFALENQYESQLESSGAAELYDEVDDETKEILKELGVDELSLEDIFNVSPRKVFTVLVDMLKGKAMEPLKSVAVIISILLVLSISESFLPKGQGKNSAGNLVATLLIITAIAIPTVKIITIASSNILLSCKFMLTFIPVYGTLIAVSGNPLSAVNFNTLLFSATQIIAQFTKAFLMPLISVFLGLNIAASLNSQICAVKVSSIIKKIITVSLTTISTVFLGFLGTRGMLATASDGLAQKGIRVFTSSVIPIIGNSLGEAYTSILGSLSLLKSTVGIFGILAIAVLNIPVVFELLLWYFSLQICSVVSSLLGQETITNLFECISNAIVIANIIVIFIISILIISIGLVLKVRTV